MHEGVSKLSKEQLAAFKKSVAESGLDVDKVLEHGADLATVKVASLSELRKRMGPADDAQRGAASLAAPKSKKDVQQKAAAFVFGSHQLQAEEMAEIEHAHFPVELSVVAAVDKIIPAGQTWKIGPDGPPQKFDFGTLTMEPGSAIEIYSTYVTMEVQNLVRK